ncbi:hypothetical protein IKB17_02955 [bacterium]|nr:hypothetical protein [bacterium]
MSEYDVTKRSVQIDPSMMKKGISKGNLELSEADKKFFEWLDRNVQAGRTYVTPSGHMVRGDDVIRSREFTKSITNVIPQDVKQEMQGINMKSALPKDTVELGAKAILPTSTDLSALQAKSVVTRELSEADKKFFEWLDRNVQAGRTYVTPSGHMVRGDDVIRSREFTKSITKKIKVENVANLIKKVKV